MALTNFGLLQSEQLLAWRKEAQREERNESFLEAFVGEGSDAMIQRTTELKKGVKGTRAIITLVHDSNGDGVVGDNTLEGQEEALTSDDIQIRVDMLRFAHKHKGAFAEQKSVVDFRKEAKKNLPYTQADRKNQLAFLTLSGVAYSFMPNGAARVGTQFTELEYAADVTAPTTRRHKRWDATDGLVAADTSAVVAADTPSWRMLVETKAYMMDEYIRPIRAPGGISYYNVFMTPQGIAKLKQDADFLAALRYAKERGDSNPIFKGTPHGGKQGIMVDGLNILEYRYVYNTKGASSGSKWGAAGAVDGQRVLFCGAQALAYAEIGLPTWVEKEFDYDNQPGIALGSVYGFRKPFYLSRHSGTTEDFSVLCVDTAI
jgi:N4-gp56 family major capsid protein